MPRCACPFAPLLEDSRRGAKRSEEHTSELQSRLHLVCRLLLEKKKNRRGVLRSANDTADLSGQDISQDTQSRPHCRGLAVTHARVELPIAEYSIGPLSLRDNCS